MSKYVAQWRGGFQVTWRNLTLAEYRVFKSAFDKAPFVEPMEVALAIYKTVMVDGPDPRYVPAGIPAFICKQQMMNNPFSGAFEDIDSALKLARTAVRGNYLMAAKAMIAGALHYRLEEIDQWDPNTFFIRLAQAELIFGRPLDPDDPNAPVDSKGRALPKKIKKDLSPSQQKALDRTKHERARG